MVEQLFEALTAIVISIGVCLLYFYGSNFLLKKAMHSGAGVKSPKKDIIQPWLFIAPALIFLIIYLVYPAFKTIYLSFYDKDGINFVGLFNYRWAFTDSEFLLSIRNNIIWLIVVPSFSTALGLIIALLTDRLWWGTIARTIIFMPMAISFVGASVIWRFVYDYRGEAEYQIGILNAIVTGFGFEPQAWISMPFWNNFFLMVILIWIQTGFAMVILGAALRGVPQDTIEASIVDGAGPVQIFFKIMIPQILPSIIVVWTTITILVLKVFDIVLTMTNGQWDTEVLGNLMFDWMFRGGGDSGRGAMLAVMIMVGVLPIMIWNIYNGRKN